jgi:hypothetical protein
MAHASITIHRQGDNPFCSVIESNEIIGSHRWCEVCKVWRRRFHQPGFVVGGCASVGVAASVPCATAAALKALY